MSLMVKQRDETQSLYTNVADDDPLATRSTLTYWPGSASTSILERKRILWRGDSQHNFTHTPHARTHLTSLFFFLHSSFFRPAINKSHTFVLPYLHAYTYTHTHTHTHFYLYFCISSSFFHNKHTHTHTHTYPAITELKKEHKNRANILFKTNNQIIFFTYCPNFPSRTRWWRSATLLNTQHNNKKRRNDSHFRSTLDNLMFCLTHGPTKKENNSHFKWTPQ